MKKLNAKAALRILAEKDPIFGQLVRKSGTFDMKMHEARNPYESLFRSIVFQQLHGKAAASILARVKATVTGRGERRRPVAR